MDDNKIFQDLEQKAQNQIDAEESILLLNLDEFLSIPYPEEHYLVEELIPKGGITIISSVPGMMKSMIMNHIVLKIAKGEMVFNKFPTRKTNALIVDMENSQMLLSKRLTSMNNGATDVPVYIFNRETYKGFSVTNEEAMNALIGLIRKYQIGFVALDSFRRIHFMDENNSKDMNIVFAALKRIQDEECSVLLLHHEGKFYEGGGKPNTSNYKDRMRGSSDILSEVDSQFSITLKKEGDETFISFKQFKNRWDRSIKPFTVKFMDDNGAFDYIVWNKEAEEDLFRCKIMEKVEYTENGISRKELLEYGKSELNIGQGKVDTILDELFNAREINIDKRDHGENFYFPAVSQIPNQLIREKNCEAENITNEESESQNTIDIYTAQNCETESFTNAEQIEKPNQLASQECQM